MKKLILFIFLSLATYCTQAQTVYVNASASGLNDGTSWFDAYTDLQTAISNTAAGEIWVATGVYYPGASANNAASFTLKNNVAIYGGFIGSETLLTQRDPLANTTTLSGDLDQSTTKNANDAYHVVSSGETNSSAILDGFTIADGNAAGAGANAVGAGMLCDGNSGISVYPIVQNCIFSDNSSAGNGGAVFIICDQTGGNSTAPKFLSCKFYGNNSLGFGGGAYIYATGSLTFSTPFFESCVFYNNAAAGSAGCIYAENNNTGEVHVTVTNCTFVGNNSGTEIQYAANGINGTFQIDNSIFYGLDLSTDDVFLGDHNCGPMGLFSATTGSINQDPMFINPGALDFGITCQSLCWEAGNNSAVTHAEDVNRNVRTVGTFVDMGAVEMPYILPTVAAMPSGTDVCEFQNVTLSGSGAVSYVWDNGVTDGIPFSPSVTTLYTVIGTDANGCTNSDAITITVHTNPTVIANATATNVCEGTNITLYGSGSATTYMWNGGIFDNVPFAATMSTVYSVTGTDVFGCIGMDNVNILVESTTGMTAGVDMDVCKNAPSVMLSGNDNGAGSVVWGISGSGTFDNPNILNPTYAFTGLDLLGSVLFVEIIITPSICPEFRDTMVINLRDLPVVSLGPDYTICETDSIYLNASITGGTGPFIYNWNDGAMNTISIANNEYYFPTATDSYTMTVSDAYGCGGDDLLTVTVDASETLSGNLNVGAGSLSDGVMYIFKYEVQQLAFDTFMVYPFSAGTGSYSFPSFPHGSYLIKVVPDSVIFPNLLSTYYGDAFRWDSATVINHNCTGPFVADINIQALLGGTGTGSISGYIIEGDGFGTRLINHHDQIFVPGGPLKGVDVKLGKNPGGGIQARTMSDSTGHYGFDNLPDDSYRIYVDIPGLPMDSFYIVNVVSDSTTDLIYYADSNSVFPELIAVGIHQYAASTNSFDVYPNPAQNNTSIAFELTSTHAASIRLMDITGKQVMNIQLNKLPKGKHEYQLNFAASTGSATGQHLSSGIYFIQVTSDTGMQTKKLVIE